MGKICQGGFNRNRFLDKDGNWINIPSGYFSYYPNPGTLTPISVRELHARACVCDSAITKECCADTDCLKNATGKYSKNFHILATNREKFCQYLYDSAGNRVTNPPAICGGTGPEILNYNPALKALEYIQDEGEDLLAKYETETKERNKKIVFAGGGIALLVLLIGLMWLFL